MKRTPGFAAPERSLRQMSSKTFLYSRTHLSDTQKGFSLKETHARVHAAVCV